MTGKSTVLILMLALFVFASLPVISVESVDNKDQAENETSALDVARMKLESAISSYKQGDTEATQSELDAAIEWLDRAAQDSKSEKSREASRQLGAKIDAFKEKLDQSPGNHENSLMHFWHQVTSIIDREIDQVSHSYFDLLVSEQTLKYLLDAKTHLFAARHDLFISHSDEDSVQELDNVLENLADASEVATPPVKESITDLSKDIRALSEKKKRIAEAWENNDVVLSLNQAMGNLNRAKDKASPRIKPRIDSLQAEIQRLQADVERMNIRNDYESAMAKLRDIINNLPGLQN